MDSHLVYDPNTDNLEIKEFRLIQKGDLVAVAQHEDGSDGVFVWTKGFQQEEVTEEEAFSFMSSDVSRENQWIMVRYYKHLRIIVMGISFG